MTKLAYFDEALANLDHVRRVKYLGNKQVEVTWSNGDVEELYDPINVMRDHQEDYFVIPAAPGHTLLQYFPDDEEMQRWPVIAWRISEDQTKEHNGDDMLIAICMDTTSAEQCSNVFTAVLAPDGVVSSNTLVGERRVFDNEEHWLETVKKQRSEIKKMEAAE
jgi:hypothetical protein